MEFGRRLARLRLEADNPIGAPPVRRCVAVPFVYVYSRTF